MTAAKITTAAKIVSTVCKVVSNAATFTQAAIGGVNNAKAIVKNMINGKLFSEDTAKNLVSFGINAFTAATSGKNLLSSSKELKKVVGDSVGSKWGKKAKKEPLLECNLQFFAEKNGCESGTETELFLTDEFYNKNLPSQVAPGTKYLPKYDEFGNVKQIKMYDDYGREIGWVDYTNHGYGDINSPHYHTTPHWHEKVYNAQYPDGIKIHHRTDVNTPMGDKR